VCDLENLKNEEAMTRVGSQRHSKKKNNHPEDGSQLEPKHVVERNNVRKTS
jgi:hypothetical protein